MKKMKASALLMFLYFIVSQHNLEDYNYFSVMFVLQILTGNSRPCV